MTWTVSNILDVIHDSLDPLVWDEPAAPEPKLKSQHHKWIESIIHDTLLEHGYERPEEWLSLVVTGSLTTYQYSDSSDCDTSMFVDVQKFPDWDRAEMIKVMIHNVDGTILPGTPHPMQCFVVGEGITKEALYQKGLRSGYDLDEDKWVVPPEHERVHDVEAEFHNYYVYALQVADKMERLLKYQPEAATEYWHQIHKKRSQDQKAGKGDYSESNIAYKMLNQKGLLPLIAEVSGEYIARVRTSGKADWFCPSYEVPDPAKGQIHQWAESLPWPEGSELQDPSKYHITSFYSPTGWTDPSHHQWFNQKPPVQFPAQAQSVETFGSPNQRGNSPVVLRFHAPELSQHAEGLMDEAEQRGLQPARFQGHLAHVTVGHANNMPPVDPPNISFQTDPMVELHNYYESLKHGRIAGWPIVRKFVYDGATHQLAMGEMAPEEGAALSHNQLFQQLGSDPLGNVVMGTVSQSGWGTFEDAGQRSDLRTRYEAEQAVRQQVPDLKGFLGGDTHDYWSEGWNFSGANANE